MTLGKPLSVFNLSFYLLHNSHIMHINAQLSSNQHSAGQREVLLLIRERQHPGYGHPKDEWPLGRSRLVLQPEGGPGGHDTVLLLSSWLNMKQGDTGRSQPPNEKRQCDLCVCLSPEAPHPAAEPSDNLIRLIPAARACVSQTHISSPFPLEW